MNYQIDGGDNNDDTVGGLLQAYPLEAIQEFNFVTQRFKAEYGRSNGDVLDAGRRRAAERSGRGAWSVPRQVDEREDRDGEDLRTGTEAGLPPESVRRQLFGGPIARDRAHFFGAVERTQQDTTQTVNTKGLFPTLDGPAPVPYRETLRDR